MNATESEDVCSSVGFLTFELLGSHVLQCTDDRALRRQAALAGSKIGNSGERRRWSRLSQPRESEVEQLRARFRQHDVRGLEIAMDHSLPVRFIECIGDLDRIFQSFFKWKWTSRQAIGKGFSFEVFHDKEIHAVLVADIVERANMLMIESCDGLRFTFEPLSQFRAGCMFGKNLDGNRSIQPRVSRPVHFSHSPRADLREDFMGTEQLSGLEHHWQGNLYQIRDAVTHLGDGLFLQSEFNAVTGQFRKFEKLQELF
jgi:hypothetical protein